ncbi:MAG: zf-HC2 domain-containing protein [Cytophagaceae bacterium]|nr:zf-HC2 domain-containing protein [Cytophagaceae bacterium]
MEKGLLSSIQSLLGIKKTPMSCCKDCLSLLYSVLDGEATENEIKYLNEHVNGCSPCYQHYHIEKAVKELIKYKIAKKEVPSDLINCIKNKLNQ